MAGVNKTKEAAVNKRESQQKRNRLMAILGCAVIVMTSLALMLPAISMTKDVAEETAGIDLQTTQAETTAQSAEAPAAQDEAPAVEAAAEPAAEPVEAAAPAEQAEAPQASEPAADATNISSDAATDATTPATDEQSDKPAATTDDSKSAASADSKDAKDENKDKEDADKMPAKEFKGELKDANDNVVLTVLVKAPEGAFPEGTTMKIDGISPDAIQDKVEDAVKKANGEDAQVKSMTAVDIVFLDKDGKEIEPAKQVEVKITADAVRDTESPVLVHVVDWSKDSSKGKTDNAEVVSRVSVVDENTTEDTLKFKTDEFSPYVIVELETITTKVITASGETYTVNVTYSPEAGIPEGAELVVKEIAEGDEGYDSYLEQASENANGEVGFARFFDITIAKDGQEIQPAVPVNVEIAMDNAAELSDNVKALHFGEDGVETIDASLIDNAVLFDAQGFSVYAVVDGSTDANARMTLEFYSSDTKIATMYVKNGDTLEELETILYDPGAGRLNEGESFGGWILDNRNYSTADIANAMNIEAVREWAESLQITEGDTHRLDAAICKLYTITYKDTDGTVLGMDAVSVKASEYGNAAVERTVKMAYTPKDDVHNFEGWTLDEGSTSNVASTVPADRIYQNDNTITIKGDISFTVNAPEGNWLVFDENGKGGKYNAPHFVKSGDTTQKPCADAEMIRNGYTFGGWYSGVTGSADEHGYKQVDETKPFTFGSEISEKTTLYAKWVPNATAPYTVIFWTQNTNRDGYELKASYVGQGTVGQNIPYTFRNNKDEDYVTVGGSDYHYTGFCVNQPEQQVTITPEGDAVLNLYFDRIEYDLRFYLYRYRDQNWSDDDYEYAQNSANGNNVWGVVNFHTRTTLANMPTVDSPFQIQSDTVDGYTSYYFVLHAYYGENISERWPTYDQLHCPANNREAVSYVMMVGTRLKPNPSSGGDGTVKGVVTTMDDGILGATNDKDGNFLIVRFNTYNDWTYHLYYEPYEGQDLTGKTKRVFNGKTYYLDHDVTSRSSNTIPASQNAPEYQGFQTVRGADDKALYDGTAPTSQIPQQNGVSGYKPYLNYYYDRLTYTINYMDGTYFDGSGNIIQHREEELLHTSNPISFDSNIPDSDKQYVPELPAGEEGYVFEGWYADAGCTTPYDFTTMPMDGIVVYAKWRQVEYRVFLHPNAGTDPSLDWGAENVSTSFRVAYGEKVSTPTGTRVNSGYEFVGWYTDPNFSSASLYNADTVLNNETVITPYPKTEETELDKWGNVETGRENYNSDANNNRFWINNKLDLYAKWRKILEGAEGINVVYTADDGKGHMGTDAPTDYATYPDQAESTAQAAAVAPKGMHFKHWVIQKWDENAGKYVDTEQTVLPGDKFIVSEEYAHKEAKSDSSGEFTYTMQLRAEYDSPGDKLPTHIWWFNNYSDSGAERHESARQDEGIQVNEAVNIQEAPTRAGYEFLGWARVPTGTSGSAAGQSGAKPTGKVLDLDENDVYLKYEDGVFKLNDSSSEYNGQVVTMVAADERLQYHDMYAVWKKACKVTVKKVVVSGFEADKSTPFGFTATGQEPFDLKDNETAEFTASEGASLVVNETLNNDFTISATATYVNDQGQEVPIEGYSNGKVFTVQGDTTITVTNTRKSFDFTFDKTDLANNGLKGAKLQLLRNDGSTYADYSGEFQVRTNEDQAVVKSLIAGNYKLVEVSAPDGYILEGAEATFTVGPDGSVSNFQSGKITKPDGSQVDFANYVANTSTITVVNKPGAALPTTGGPGTVALTVVGTALIVLAAGILVLRRRPQAARPTVKGGRR